jgi:hypothetical protein
VPVRLCVKSDIKSPFIIRAAVVRIEEHEDRRQLPVSVENILRRICRDIHQPLQILNKHKGSIHIHSSMLLQEGEADEVRIGLVIFTAFIGEIQSLLYSVHLCKTDVVLEVRLVHLNHLKT